MDFDAIVAADTSDADGTWVDQLPGLGDARLKVRLLSSPRVMRAWGRITRAVPKRFRDKDGALTPDAEEQSDRDLYARHVLVDWANLTRAGEPVPFSADTAREWMDVPLFEAAVRFAAARVTAEAREAQAALEKN